MKKNIGFADRMIRIALALILAALYFTHTVTGVPGIILLTVGGIMLATAFFGFCGIYSLFSCSTIAKKSDL